jgi:putative endopeptidase
MQLLSKSLYQFIFILVLSSSCKQKNDSNAYVGQQRDILIENRDTNSNPAKDFFAYACGNWIKSNPIPDTESSWTIGHLIEEETYERLKEISEKSALNTNLVAGSNDQKIGDFYFTGMDTLSIEKNGLSELKVEFDKMESINNTEQLLQLIANHHSYGAEPMFGFYIFQDEKNSEKNVVHLYQGGLGMPDRDYYFNEDKETKIVREEYKKHVQKIFILLGNNKLEAEKNSNTVYDIENALAKVSRKLEDLRDTEKNYNKMSVEKLSKSTPNINWKNYLAQINLSSMDTLIVGQPEFFTALNKLVSTVSINNWKVYLKWHFTKTFADRLTTSLDKESFAFYGTVLSGATKQRPRWKRVIDATESAMGDALGQLYVQKYVSAAFKERYTKLTNDIFETFADRIKGLDWMSDETKTKALVKLNSTTKKVAYPDKWRDYSKMQIDRASYFSNSKRANLWAFNYEIEKLNKPVDRTLWDMTPQTYNAYYNPSNNEIVLPAAIFAVPGIADSLLDDAIVYAYAGASTIGHEITHGFDDQGRQFDEKGNLNNWWTKSDEDQFLSRTKKIVNQFNSFVVLENKHINGEATQGENIADLGGVVLGFEAFKKTEQYKSKAEINGISPEQRYFMGYALAWLGHQRDKRLAMQIMTDVHSPAKQRVNGPVVNLEDFYKAFNVKSGDGMYQPDSLRVNIW